jgi:CO dehydrogenase/acetyl-CoA synthase delta subunit
VSSCGCRSQACCPAAGSQPPWVLGSLGTPAGEVPVVGTRLAARDRLGAWKVRWSIGRMDYTAPPGLYAVGEPTPTSPVLVSANYKLSFDVLRSKLTGRDAWILVLDTKGVNVWCSAGKGTFCAEEIARQVEATRLPEVVSHRTLVLPQLSATGVSARDVGNVTGFRVVYGPVRAADLPAFLEAGMQATAEMRRVRFGFLDRVTLIPVELVGAARYAAIGALVLLVLGGLGRDGYSVAHVLRVGLPAALLFLSAYLVGVALPPALLPWLPGRAFSWKGATVGLAFGLAVVGYALARPGSLSLLQAASWLLIAPAVASFLALNFTGASTYTSLSGVRRETAVAIRVQRLAAVAGVLLWVVGLFA